jgi:hypothetical protein
MEWYINTIIAVCSYLLGMAFAGSFLGRKWMGTVDLFLHDIFKREVTIGKYLYWKHFCNIKNPPKPPSLKNPIRWRDMVLAKIV